MKTLEEQMKLVQSLNVIDDIFFHKIAEDKEVCEEMLRVILEMPELKVIQSQVQRFLRNNGAHSVILDALCELGNGSTANIEVQKADDDNHQKRVRFNQSNIDTTFTEKGINYEELPDTYMVFISKFDIFAKNRTIYHIDRIIRETGDVVENGIHEIYVNVAVNDGSEIADLMQYFKDSNGINSKFVKLSNRVNYFKYEKEGVKIMAALFEKYLTEEQRKGIRGIAKSYLRFQQSPESAKDAILEEYPDVDETLIDEILDDIYSLAK